MVKYIDIELLKKEINRLYQEHSTRDYCDEACSVLDQLEDFIDSLQQEQSKIEEDWVEKRKQECGCRKLSNGNYQCERYEGVLGPCDGRCSWIVDYPKLAEEEMSNKTLDEAAGNFVWEVMENDEEGISDLCQKLRPSSKISDFYDALGEFFKAGAEWQKAQMMKEAVEGTVMDFSSNQPRPQVDVLLDPYKYHTGDKVCIIIIKEEESK